MSLPSDLNKKLFGHCKITWKIENFSLQTITKDWLIQSPEFNVKGSEETWWSMDLQPIKKDNMVLFSLKRSTVDLGPKYISLNLKIYFKICNERSVSCNDTLVSMKNGSKYGVYMISVEYLLSQMNRSSDIFTIVCYMIAYSNSASRGFGECNHAGVKLLSRDMLDLYRSARYFDTKLVFNDNVILAHKSVLCARNEYIACLIEDEIDEDEEYFEDLVQVNDFQNYTSIDFFDILDYKGMRKILAYLYTGDMRHVLEEPSFDIHYCASFLEITEIETHYEPDSLIIKSAVDLEEYTYTLRGYEFHKSRLAWKIDIKKCMTTHQLIFHANREIEIYIPLFTKAFQRPMNGRLKLNFVYKSGHLCSECLFFAGSAFIDMNNRIDEIIKSHSSNEILEVIINLKLTASMKISLTEENRSVSVNCVNEDFYYNCYSESLGCLLDGGPFTDSLIDNNGVYFWAHKCVLAARSQWFSDVLTTNEEGEVIGISSFDPYIISVILTYIYTGFLADVIDDDVIEVYKAAVFSKLFMLKSMCSDWLKSSSKIDRTIRCRILRIAEEYGDTSLMKSVLSNLFDAKDIYLMTNNEVSFQDVHICRHCASIL